MDASERETLEKSVFEIIHATKGLLTWYREIGIDSLGISERSLEILRSWSNDGQPLRRKQDTFPPKVSTTSPLQEILRDQRKTDLPQQMLDFQGPDSPKIIFVLDVEEARSGKKTDVYEGPAGELLLKIFAAIHLGRESVQTWFFPRINDPKDMRVFFRNINRRRDFFREHILKFPPEMICTMGEAALHLLLDNNFNIKESRGRFHDYEGIPLMPTLHPVELIKDPSLKGYVWEDLKKIMKRVGL